MKIRIRMLAVLFCIFLLAACGGGNAASSANNEPSDAGSSPDNTSGETAPEAPVVVGLGFDVTTLDPGHSYEYYASLIMSMIYDNLLKLTPGSNEPQPCLAESYTVDGDNLTYTFKLRQDVKFFSGNPLTSKDVKFSFDRMKHLKTNSSIHLEGVESVETPDDYTVVVKLSAPDSSFTTKLTVQTFAILDSAAVAANGGLDTEAAETDDTAEAYINDNPAGSGPFMVKSFRPSVEIELVRNPDYWGVPAASERVIVRNMSDANSALMMLQNGDLDVALNMTPQQLPQLTGSAGIVAENVPTNTITYLLMNQDAQYAGPIADPDVRRAIAYAINYKNIHTLAGEGAFTPYSMVQSSFVGYYGERPADYTDLEKAKELMTKAGYPNGFDITLEVGDYEAAGVKLTDLAQLVVNDLAQIGINATISVLESNIAVQKYVEGKQGFALWLWTPDYNELNNQLAFMPDQKCGRYVNWTADMSPRIAELTTLVISELDTNQRAAYAKELQALAADGGPWLNLCQHPRIVAYRSDISDVESNDSYHLFLNTLARK
jgi:peptide/nickel transport system substrate-binding protein